jgi:hypothetical protein
LAWTASGGTTARRRSRTLSPRSGGRGAAVTARLPVTRALAALLEHAIQ